jgi:hypothetical protein
MSTNNNCNHCLYYRPKPAPVNTMGPCIFLLRFKRIIYKHINTWYYTPMPQKAFTIGNSTAITIPPKANIKPGTRLKLKKVSKTEITYEILQNTGTGSVKDYVAKVTDGYDIGNTLTQAELMEKLDFLEKHPYEKTHSIS